MGTASEPKPKAADRESIAWPSPSPHPDLVPISKKRGPGPCRGIHAEASRRALSALLGERRTASGEIALTRGEETG